MRSLLVIFALVDGGVMLVGVDLRISSGPCASKDAAASAIVESFMVFPPSDGAFIPCDLPLTPEVKHEPE